MHDPKTVAFEIKRPWPEKRALIVSAYRYYPALIRVWHVDPETDGTDRSCGYLSCVEGRPWYKHPRWHVWHWQIQIPALQDFQRWMWGRCSKCGGRFSWGYSPIGPWSGGGPRWFRSEKGIYHHDCNRGDTKPPTDMAKVVT